jgi:hypothetical protein
MKMQIPKKYQKMATADSIDVDMDGSLTLWLNYGFAFDADENPNVATHVRTFDTFEELVDSLKYVEICPCSDCVTYKGKTV